MSSPKLDLSRYSNHPIVELIGWIAAGLILLAYALLSFGYLSSQHIFYQGLNLIGSIGLIMVALPDRAWQPVVLNIIWALLAVIALISIVL